MSEVIFLVLPLLALADLVEGSAELGRGPRRVDENRDDAADTTEVRAQGKAVLFYAGFVVSASLALVGLLIAPPAGFLAAQISVFFLMAWCLFSQVGDDFLIGMAHIYKDSGGSDLIEPGSRIRPRDTLRIIAILRHRAGPEAIRADVDEATAKALMHRRRVAVAGILTIPALTFVVVAFVIVVDVTLCASGSVVGS